MPYVSDGLVGKLALRKGWISAEQLQAALAEQAAAERDGLRKPLGVILVAQAGLKEEQIVELLEEQKRLQDSRAGETAERREDHLFGQILVKRGVASPEQIHQALRLQAERAERGELPIPRLGQILMEMGIEAPKVQEALQGQTKALYGCPGCGLRYNIKLVEGGKRYRCRKCGALLVAVPSSGDQRADASAYGLHLEVAEALPPEVATADLDPANRFDKYVLLDLIGRGGAGSVFRAWQRDLRRIVALKILRGSDEETVQRFAREAQTAARLKHPGIVSVYETGRVEGVWFLSMEYVDGRPLDRLEKLDPRRLASLLRDVALAVHHAHEHGVLHRDLKPQNILVDAQGKPYVTDFGLARPIEGGLSLTKTGMVVGTPAYMSPEQARGDAGLDGRSDVHGLGAVLYELIAGRVPFGGSTALDTALAVINQDPVPPRRFIRDLPADLEAVCLKALEKTRERRYASAKALAEDLQRFVEGEPVQAIVPTTLSRVIARARRNPLRTAAVAVAAAGILLLAALFAAMLGESKEARELLRASRLEKEGKLQEALAVYRRHPSAEADARRIEDALARASAAERRARAEDVLKGATPDLPAHERSTLATTALTLCPDLEAAWVLRAAVQREQQDNAGAYASLGEAAARSAFPLPHWLARAELARKLGRTSDEIDDLGRAIALSPLSEELRRQLRSAHLRAARACLDAQGDLKEVVMHLLRTEDEPLEAVVDGLPPPARRALAGLLTEAALAACPSPGPTRRAAAKAVECDPGFAPAWAARALGAYLEGKDAAARADAERALELLPTLPEARALRGMSKARQGQAEGWADVDGFLQEAPTRPSLRPLRTLAEELKRSSFPR